MSKLRVGGETIDPKEQYNGARVIKLLNVSYNNGYSKGTRELNNSIQVAHTDGFNAGFNAGYEEASKDLTQLKELLAKLLEQH